MGKVALSPSIISFAANNLPNIVGVTPPTASPSNKQYLGFPSQLLL